MASQRERAEMGYASIDANEAFVWLSGRYCAVFVHVFFCFVHIALEVAKKKEQDNSASAVLLPSSTVSSRHRPFPPQSHSSRTSLTFSTLDSSIFPPPPLEHSLLIEFVSCFTISSSKTSSPITIAVTGITVHMPSRRRSGRSLAAAALPARRLPVGTPPLTGGNRSFGSISQESSDTVSTPSSATGDSLQPHRDRSFNATVEQMAPHESDNHDAPISIAQAKLQRQQKRNEETDPTAHSQVISKARSQTARQKGKQWKPFDFSTDSPASSRPGTPCEAVNPLPAVRVNTFRLPSSGVSNSRSVSVLSQRTSEEPSDFELKDSAIENSGFQVYKPRRKRKDLSELSVYSDDKSEERQSTVEASYDTREIYEVFGNALPGQEFLEQNVGHESGQLQFLKHPNGDISAHQWSESRFQWDNIGQYSNIRKRVEGQLASERLRGETASQTLLQNTLAYFRAIAKQREASVMGLPFGAKEIHALLPIHQPEPMENAKQTKDSYHEESKAIDQTGTQKRSILSLDHTTGDAEVLTDKDHIKSSYDHWKPASQQKQSDSFSTYATLGKSLPRQDDPFTAVPRWPHTPISAYHYSPQSSHLPGSTSAYHPLHSSQGLNYDFHFPSPGSFQGQGPLGPGYPNSHPFHTNRLPIWSQPRVQANHNILSPPQRTPWNPMANFQPGRDYCPQVDGSRREMSDANPVSRSKLIMPFTGSHTDRLDKLVKIGDAAKERSLSQANIRTVLYDPLQNASRCDQHSSDQSRKALDKSPTISFDQDLMPQNRSPTPATNTSEQGIARSLQPPLSPSLTVSHNNLKDSSPDTSWSKRPYEHSTPLIATSQTEPITPGFIDDLASSMSSSYSSAPVGTTQSHGQTYEEVLHGWWTSGNRLSRQNDLFQRIKAASKHLNDDHIKNGDARSASNSFGTRFTTTESPATVPWNETATRLLIPVQETLASYVQGPEEKRRDYFTPWTAPPEWAIDRDITANQSFYDQDWGRPPNRIGRDPRYRPMPAIPMMPSVTGHHSRFASSGWRGDGRPAGASMGMGGGMDGRFAFASGRY